MHSTKIKELRKLSQKKFREESGLFVVEGTKSVMDLLHSELEVEAVYGTAEWMKSHKRELRLLEAESVTENELSRISCLTTPQDVFAVARSPHYGKDEIDEGKFLLALDGIRDPGNLGTMLRTADWFGIRQVVCSADCVEWTNPKVIQATMGSFTRVKVIYTDLPSYLKTRKSKSSILGTFMEGAPLQRTDFQAGDIIVIGSEGKGISSDVASLVTRKVSIPAGVGSGERAESLNASIAAAIVLYEACRSNVE